MRHSRTLLASLAVTAAVLATAAPAHAAAPGYTALGDSYSSGVGTREYYSDSGGCQRSPHAYPVIDAGRLGATLTFAACSGARVTDVQGQLGALNSGTSYVTVSVGGNDAGFADVITQCAKPWPYTCTTEINNANNFIRNTLPARLDGLYAQIKAKAPNARVAVVGYPRLFNGQECNFFARISPGEQSALNGTADLLATTTAGRAAAAGFAFVDSRAAFTGHAVCSSSEWVNGLSNPVSESYHPNRAGQVGYANIVEPVLRGTAAAPAFKDTTPSLTDPAKIKAILDAEAKADARAAGFVAAD
ncbi:SGNH/GDSL hydrolase family protein [Longispora albida]|uniref:SGNH/GDSL hydrolase family protein n=1 Tax=Longispora albida TaxID=203523 RepID=UPI00037C4E57|nr:SGNH/GDSL hydrolase family protein [Longispora albida]